MAMTKSKTGSFMWMCAGAALAAAWAFPARALDVDAGDYTALPPGTNLGVLYLQHAERKKLYSNGDAVLSNARLDSDVGILRGVHYTTLGGYTVDPQFLLPFGRLDAGGDIAALGDRTGIADLIVAMTVWVHNDPKNKSYFGITPFIWLPTGSYDKDRPLNLGENRWKAALQFGYITPLSDKVTLDLVGDATWYGENDEFGPTRASLKQDVSYQVQTHFRYHINQATHLGFLYSHTWGGETEVDGVKQDDRLNNGKVAVSVGHFFTPTMQGQAALGRDVKVESGFKEDWRLNLRLLKVF